MKRLSTDELQTKYGISRRVITEMVRAGFVQPERGVRREYRFGFQDIQLLRMAQELYAAGISPLRTVRFLQQLTSGKSEGATRLRVRGRDLVVREGNTLRTPSGQLVIDFEESGQGTVRALPHPIPGEARQEMSAQEWFLAALYCETADPARAEACYRNAIRCNTCYADAYINLCCLLVDRKDWQGARVLCEQAIQQCPDAALLHYNLGVVREEHDDFKGALASYRRALDLDPELADAHHNLGILLDTMGERAAAIRHLREYRKLS